MGLPGFTAETSLYTTVGHYLSASKYGSSISDVIGTVPRWAPCDTIGQRCCGPDGDVNTPHCHKGLGCNVATGFCEACGAPGQVCCDGDFTGFTTKSLSYTRAPFGERLESCDSGARCDAQRTPGSGTWTGSRRCQSCGNKFGGPCCAPDIGNALGRCSLDVSTGSPLVCDDPFAGAAGRCVICGQQAGQPACLEGYSCADGLVERDGLCTFCGWPGQPPCDRGEPCRGNNSVPNRFFTQCLAAGGPNQPCRKDGGCEYQGTFCNGRICEPCGNPGQLCCPPGTLKDFGRDIACQQPGECRENRCFACGYDNMPVCLSGGPCRSLSEPIGGWCRPCGKEGQRCCSSSTIIGRCLDDMRCNDGVCRRPSPPPPPPPPTQWKTCNGEPWGFSTMKRTVFIKRAGSPCLYDVTYNANSIQEALACARRDAPSGDEVVTQPINSYTFALTSSYGCHADTYYGIDEDEAQACAQLGCINCSVTPGGCF